MCGIAGYHSKSVKYSTEKFNLAMDTLSHRGPDDTGFFVSNKKIKAHAHCDSSKKKYEVHIIALIHPTQYLAIKGSVFSTCPLMATNHFNTKIPL